MRLVIGAILFGSLLLPINPASAASVQLIRLGPGPTGNIPPVLTATGALLFESEIIEPEGPGVPTLLGRRLVHVSNAGEREVVADVSSLVFQGGVAASSFETLDHWNGTTVVEASNGSSSGVFAVDEAGTVRRLAGPGDPLPTGSGTFAEAVRPYVGPAGIVFRAQNSDGVVQLYFEDSAGHLELIADSGQLGGGLRQREYVVSDTGAFFVAGNDLYHVDPGETPQVFLPGGSLDLQTGFELDVIDRVFAVDSGFVYFLASERPIGFGAEAEIYRMTVDGGVPEHVDVPAVGTGGTLSADGDDILYGRVAAIIDGEFVPILVDGDTLLDREVFDVLSGRHALMDRRAVFRVVMPLGVQEPWMAVIVPEPRSAALLVMLLGFLALRSGRVLA